MNTRIEQLTQELQQVRGLAGDTYDLFGTLTHPLQANQQLQTSKQQLTTAQLHLDDEKQNSQRLQLELDMCQSKLTQCSTTLMQYKLDALDQSEASNQLAHVKVGSKFALHRSYIAKHAPDST